MVQFLYMFVTYNFCTTICYTAINLPYGSLSAMMTRISGERDMLSIVRMGMTGLLSLTGYISSTTGTAVQPQSAIDMIMNIYKFDPSRTNMNGPFQREVLYSPFLHQA